MSADNLTHGVILDLETIDRGDLNLTLLNHALPNWIQHKVTTPDQCAQRIANANVIVSNKVALGRNELEQAHNLKLICIAATGTNNVDLDAAREFGITVCNARAYATQSVAQHVFTLLLALKRKLLDIDTAVNQGRWHSSPHFCLFGHKIEELGNKTLGIIGYGELGKAVATIAAAFGMHTIIANRPGSKPTEGRMALPELLNKADIISLHCPLTARTKDLISVNELQQMGPDAILINTARGGIVNELALANALRGGIIAGAGIDTLETEPPTTDSPLLQGDIPNLIITPHVAWASQTARQNLVTELTKNIQAYISGVPRNMV